RCACLDHTKGERVWWRHAVPSTSHLAVERLGSPPEGLPPPPRQELGLATGVRPLPDVGELHTITHRFHTRYPALQLLAPIPRYLVGRISSRRPTDTCCAIDGILRPSVSI